MHKYHILSFLLVAFISASAFAVDSDDKTAEASATEKQQAAELEGELISDVQQITFEGRRAGEGYFSRDGRKMVFQSERDPANPFYQIYVTDLETGDIEKVSPGQGKTTCAWIHPDGDRVLFASTHDDPAAVKKQQDEFDLRASGKERRYAWDYDETFELYQRAADGTYKQLTDAKGYDAEGSYSPDGKLIAFSSNRQAYERELSEREQHQFKLDPAVMCEIYIMNADGTNLKRLTNELGYDGGPFFSPDGTRICWRRFSVDGATAEVFTMRIDGTDVRRLTNLGAMSWAPFYHPSGDYLIFATNKHGFANFELYLVRADGTGDPVRVTHTEGFDGLPVFLPDGQRLAWTSNRTPEKRSQIFMGQWNDAEARRRLGLVSGDDRNAAIAAADASTPDFSPTDVMRHVDFLTRRELGGRLTGTEGERRATAYVAAYLESIGLEPAGENGSFFQSFDFPAGSSLSGDNEFKVGDRSLKLDQQWRPLSFSRSGDLGPTEVVFAGYGMQVPESNGMEEYDSYVHLDVRGKWVMVLRDLPQEITPERRQQIARYSSPRRKATVARDLGAKGIIFVAGPTSKVKQALIRFDRTASQAGVSLAVVSIDNEIAASMFKSAGKDLAETQAKLDDGSMQMGFALEGVTAAATIGIERKTGTGRNVIARLTAGEKANWQQPVVILGAHIDHLGSGGSSSSLATDDEREQIHLGADDNASGVAAMLEIAQYLASEKKSGRLQAKRDFVVAAWSGEELGLFGSQAFVSSYYDLYPQAPKPHPHAAHGHGHAHPHGESVAADKHGNKPAHEPTEKTAQPHHAADAHSKTKGNAPPDVKVAPDSEQLAGSQAHAHGTSPEATKLTAAVATYLNLDMVGRLSDKLIVQGIGSSPGFAGEVQRRNVPVRLELKLDKSSTRLPTDASAFVARDVPILSAFTGAHEDYHTPRDTPDKLNYDGAAQVSRLFALLSRGFLTAAELPKFELNEGKKSKETPRVRMTAYLGTIPDYAAGDVKGAKLSGVGKGGPAEKAGVRGGDIIVKLAGRKVEDLYDYTYAIEALKIGEEVEIVVQRGEKTIPLKITPASRD